jgi:hypothetical protein
MCDVMKDHNDTNTQITLFAFSDLLTYLQWSAMQQFISFPRLHSDDGQSCVRKFVQCLRKHIYFETSDLMEVSHSFTDV